MDSVLLFVITVIIDVHSHRFEIIVSEINENVDLVLGMKNVFKLEGVINSLDCFFKVSGRIPTHLSKRMCCFEI